MEGKVSQPNWHESFERAKESGNLEVSNMGDDSADSHAILITGIPDAVLSVHQSASAQLGMTVGQLLTYILSHGGIKAYKGGKLGESE